MEQKKRVLIVEDEKNIVDIIRFNLLREGYDTLEATTARRVLPWRAQRSPTSSCWT